jgi:type IV secretory pathway VirB10-like protein
MKKQLNVDATSSELSGGSAFFPSYKGSVSPAPKKEEASPPPSKSETVVTPKIDPVPPVRVVPPVPPKKRFMKQRHPFDIYQDQYEALQELALEERKLGGVGSMSAMVREAIDKLISEKRDKNKS